MFSLGCATPDKPVPDAEAFTAPESIQPIIDKAEAGDAEAQWSLASLIHDGIGVERDNERVVYWLRRAAEQDHAQSQYMLSLAHQVGQGVGEDLGHARHWLRKAAGNGHSEAMYDLAKFLALGIGGEADESESMKWCRASAEQGFATAQARLGAIHVEGEYGVDKNPDEGARYIKRVRGSRKSVRTWDCTMYI